MATANITAVITAEDKASGVLKGFANNTEAANNKVRDMANKAAIALGAAGVGITLFAKNATEFTVDYVKNARTLARETGNTIEESSKLMHVTERLGISTEEASRSFGLFSKNIVSSDKAFTQIGVSLNNANGKQRTFNEILLDTADRFRGMPDGVNKTALALDLFGRSGKDMIKVLNLGSSGIRDLEAQADKLGLTLNSSNIASISKYIESQKKLTESTTALKLAIGETTAPILTSFNLKINDIILSLVATDSPMRGLTANVLAFGGPALSFAGAALAMAANLTTVISQAGSASRAIAGLQATAALGIVIPVAGALAALAAVSFAIYEVDKALDKISKGVDDLNKKKVNIGKNITVSGTSDLGLIQQFKAAFGFRASGGPVRAGQPYVVGEKEPELFVPDSSGQIFNSKQMQSGTPSVININLNAGAFMGSDVEARKFAQTILGHLKDAAGSKNMSVAQLIGA